MTAWLLTTGAQWLSWIDSHAAAEAAKEGLVLARQSASPFAISHSRWALALALAESDPDRAWQLLAEASAFDYENTLLITACTAAGRVGEWSLLLRMAASLLRYEQRTGLAGDFNLSGILNLVARGLAPSEPQTAAQIQGAVTGLTHRLSVEQPTLPAVEGVATSRPFTATPMGAFRGVEFFREVRRDTSRLLVEGIGEPRMRELRALGAAMDRDQICAFARAAIATHFAPSPTT